MKLSNLDANDSGFLGSENIRPEYALGLGGLEARVGPCELVLLG
jgi:hypothetical protein